VREELTWHDRLKKSSKFYKWLYKLTHKKNKPIYVSNQVHSISIKAPETNASQDPAGSNAINIINSKKSIDLSSNYPAGTQSVPASYAGIPGVKNGFEQITKANQSPIKPESNPANDDSTYNVSISSISTSRRGSTVDDGTDTVITYDSDTDSDIGDDINFSQQSGRKGKSNG
jgi:hypothetical protein